MKKATRKLTKDVAQQIQDHVSNLPKGKLKVVVVDPFKDIRYLPMETSKKKGKNVPVISVTPTSNDYGNVKVKRSKTVSYVVKNNGKANLSMTSVITGTDATMFAITTGGGSKSIKPGKSLTIKAAFKPTSTGSKSANLEITSNDPNSPTIDIALSGTGL